MPSPLFIRMLCSCHKILALTLPILFLLSQIIYPAGALRAALEKNKKLSQLETSTQVTQNTTESLEPLMFFLEPIYQSSDNMQISQNAKEYLWEKAFDTPEQYQWNFCETWCNGSHVVTESRYKCETPKCVSCFCDRPACELYGLCCPDYPSLRSQGPFRSQGKFLVGNDAHGGNHFVTLEENKRLLDASNDDNLHALELTTNSYRNSQENPDIQNINDIIVSADKVKCGFSYDGYHLYIQSCPGHFQDSHIKKLCEEDYDASEGVTEDIITRVSDTVGGVVYYNKYCAICNQAKEVCM
ncbi:hypothetical protein ElyMa_003289600 [Elysia marginata]|uniref:SMB domain-containing protein n=1 Tax=Elysia marginata TaxID=1093978 RepID=A0AAV4JAP8_9GAST|nr:hypothetical protein ElyMa_003289600 [Elysia marginata]